jgi:hypothetical protein
VGPKDGVEETTHSLTGIGFTLNSSLSRGYQTLFCSWHETFSRIQNLSGRGVQQELHRLAGNRTTDIQFEFYHISD